jgi:hypothetical protein
MAETTVKELVPLIHHVPFVLVFIVAAIIAVRRREISSRRKKLLLTGLALLLLERVVTVWLPFADLTVTPPENAVIVARRISTVIYLDWSLSVVGVIFLIIAALSREDAQSQGVMPNTSLERTRDR